MLQLYLVELTSVTLAATRGLAAALRNRAGNYLLVLTHDYERIDFVLIERLAPRAEPGQTISQKQVSVRPRILTVERRNPSKVDLRVLRRLNYTELDPIAQYEKLKSAFDIAYWSADHFNNRALFADYYLSERLREHAEWKEDAKPIFLKLRALYDRAASRWAGKSEKELRSGLLEPVLDALGFHTEAVKPAGDDRPEPDYRLRTTDGTLLALCLAYRWNRFLDGKDEGARYGDARGESRRARRQSSGDVARHRSPSSPTANTGGCMRRRRIPVPPTTTRSTSKRPSPSTTPTIRSATSGYCSAAKPWSPVTPSSMVKRRGRRFVEQLLRQSEQYAKQLGERLKDRVFEEIFPHFADGFIASIRATRGLHGAELDQNELDAVFHGTLDVPLPATLSPLCRGARSAARERSARLLRRQPGEAEARSRRHRWRHWRRGCRDRISKKYSTTGCGLYERLGDLFRAIDRGDAERNVPVYNGGLFLTEVDSTDQESRSAERSFLARQHRSPIGTSRLGLDLLARDDDDKTFERVFIDYKSLGVRQLGSIYEGLLEFRLRIAAEKMAICKGKKTEEIVAYTEAAKDKRKILTIGQGKNATERTLPKGAVYLENDKRERKATGSYYTPDYIVEYIVANTVGPVLTERMDRVRPLLRDAQKALHREREKAQALQRRSLKGDDPEHQAFLTHHDAIDALFGIKVVDPAMGSGHFLVEAVDFITDRMLDFLNGFPWNPIVYQLRETRETILHELDEQGVTVDAAKLTDVNLLKRHVLKRCIYGVDINPMAVELAKVSLWLDSFTLGAPLSFLDHHLKCWQLADRRERGGSAA